MNEWQETTVAEICEVFDGPHATPKKTQAGPIFLGIATLQKGRIDFSETEHLSEEDFKRWTRRVTPSAGDVVSSYETKLGEAAIIREGLRCCLGRRMALMRPRPNKVDGRFLLYYYLGPEFQDVIRTRTIHGSTVERIALIEFPKFPVRLPPLAEQRAIARVLGALDDKIELNRRMNETLEVLAQSLFKSWFMDATQHGLPRDWRIDSLDKVAHFLNGLALQKFPPDGENSLPVIKIAQLRAGNTNGADWAGSNVPSEYVIEDGDVLFSWSGSLEVELWCGGRGALNQHLFKVTSATFPKWFYFLWTRYHLPVFRAIAAGKATTMGHIQRRHLSEAEVFIPTDVELEKMNGQMSPIIEKIIANNLESRTLAALRDTLLPKLLSGEVSVSKGFT